MRRTDFHRLGELLVVDVLLDNGIDFGLALQILDFREQEAGLIADLLVLQILAGCYGFSADLEVDALGLPAHAFVFVDFADFLRLLAELA